MKASTLGSLRGGMWILSNTTVIPQNHYNEQMMSLNPIGRVWTLPEHRLKGWVLFYHKCVSPQHTHTYIFFLSHSQILMQIANEKQWIYILNFCDVLCNYFISLCCREYSLLVHAMTYWPRQPFFSMAGLGTFTIIEDLGAKQSFNSSVNYMVKIGLYILHKKKQPLKFCLLIDLCSLADLYLVTLRQ